MNLFIAGWNLPEEWRPRLLSGLKRMNAVYPRLDPATAWYRTSVCGTVCSASIHTGNQAAAPRQYVSADESRTVLYSGLPLNPAAVFPAHRSEALFSHWDQLTESLEGMFCILRVTYSPSPRLELLTDIVGMEQVYYFREGNVWLISNSVRLIEETVGNLPLDPLGVSLFLSTSWVGDSSTLKSKVRVVPGGERWVWQEGSNAPRKEIYYSPAKLAHLQRKKMLSSDWDQLSASLVQTASNLGRNFNALTCALTGGRDTRLVSSLFVHTGLPAEFYTFGEPSGTDAKIAGHIAQLLGLKYRLVSVTSAEVLNNWDEVCRQIIFHGDGMANIDLIATVLSCGEMGSDLLRVDVGGTGGELGKGFYTVPDLNLFFRRYDVGMMQHYMADALIGAYGGAVKKEALELSREYVYDFVREYTGLGFDPVDIPDLYFLYSRLRRKRGSNKRVYSEYQDFFTPCLTRPFIEAIFSMTPQQRYTQPVHYNITRRLSPALHDVPFDSGRWKSQTPAAHLIKHYGKLLSKRFRNNASRILGRRSQRGKTGRKAHTATDMFDQTTWFEEKRAPVREFCLDARNSAIWDFVERSEFEKISSPASDPGDLAQYGHYIGLFFRVATLRYYESVGNEIPM